MEISQKYATDYRPRIVDSVIRDFLSLSGAVVIEGPRGCGKTRTALQASQSAVFLDDPQQRSLLEIAPEVLLEGAAPRLLDEWQTAPDIWNFVRRAVDQRQETGQFILTGSAVPADDLTRHTGAARFLRLQERTMTTYERLLPDSFLSLAALFDGEKPVTNVEQLSYGDVLEHCLTSGFPGWQQLDIEGQRVLLSGYAREITRSDLSRVGLIRHAPGVLEALLRSLARNACGELKYTTLAADLQRYAPNMRPERAALYVGLLERLFIVERLEAWAPALRSRARLRNTPKIQMLESAFVGALLKATPEKLMQDTQTAGFLFESAVIHDLRVYAQACGAQLYYYRDSNGKEIDAVVVQEDGRWGAIEVKLGAGQIPNAMKSLSSAIADIDERVVGSPTFTLVITGTGPTMTLKDGTVTVPLVNLGP